MRNNKGKNFVKTYFETRQDIDDEVFLLFKTIFKSNKQELISNIQKLDINSYLIDFGILYVTNNGGFWNDLVSYGMQKNDSNLYVKTAIELSENDVRFRSEGFDELNYLVVNKENLNKLSIIKLIITKERLLFSFILALFKPPFQLYTMVIRKQKLKKQLF